MLQLLSSDAAEQLSYLENIGDRVCVDELALDFDHVFGMLPMLQEAGDLAPALLDLIERLNSQLDGMSGDAHQQLWTPAALETAEEWTQVRALAREALDALRDATPDATPERV
jgi:hypothetical protein